MELQDQKCVIVVDEALPLGILANTAAILGITLGKKAPELIGPDVTDGTGREHLGIIAIPVPILKGSRESIKALRQTLYEAPFAGLTVVDFSDIAQSCNTYPLFIEKIAGVPQEQLQYFGVAILGEKAKVNKLTGSLPLLR